MILGEASYIALPYAHERRENPITQAPVTPQQRQAAKREIVRQMEQGAKASLARTHSPVPMHRTTVYRLLKRVQHEGEQAFADGRHGHPVKLRGEVLTFLKEHCQSNPFVSSSVVQHLLYERFGLSISVSQLNRVRVALGLSRKPVPREKIAESRVDTWYWKSHRAENIPDQTAHFCSSPQSNKCTSTNRV